MLDIDWLKLAKIIKTQEHVGNSDVGLSRILGIAPTAIHNWYSGSRDLPLAQKARMLMIGGYQRELAQMLSLLPISKKKSILEKLVEIESGWSDFLKNQVKPIPFPDFSDLAINKSDEELVDINQIMREIGITEDIIQSEKRYQKELEADENRAEKLNPQKAIAIQKYTKKTVS